MKKFFLTGPNRTGTTLLARCISDHPNCLCLFESNIHVNAFGGIRTVGHSGRMNMHGFSREQTKSLRKKVLKNNAESLFRWYDECANILRQIYDKPHLTCIGDKNPYFHTSNGFTEAISHCPKIWTIRDPRAVWYSGAISKKSFFKKYIANVKHFLPQMNNTTLIVRFEDLVREPSATMRKVYDFLEVSQDDSFLNRKASKYDRRFRWNPNSIDNVDLSQLNKWQNATLPKKILRMPLVKEIMGRFNYE